jgi:hypothetical protein
MELTANKTILRIETWHGLMLTALFAAGWTSKVLDPTAILIGGVFMGLNFLLLGYGVASLITPLASRGRIKAGIGLLVLKIFHFFGTIIDGFLSLQHRCDILCSRFLDVTGCHCRRVDSHNR